MDSKRHADSRRHKHNLTVGSAFDTSRALLHSTRLRRSVNLKICCAIGLSFITEIMVQLTGLRCWQRTGELQASTIILCSPQKCRQIKFQFLQRQCPREGVHVYMTKLSTSIDYDTAINNGLANTAMDLQMKIDLDGHGSFKNKS